MSLYSDYIMMNTYGAILLGCNSENYSSEENLRMWVKKEISKEATAVRDTKKKKTHCDGSKK